jgi:hypothetical protein
MRPVASVLVALPLVMAFSSSLLAQEPELVIEPPPDIAIAPPVRTYVFEAAATAGYATVPIRGGVNPFGAGFGGRLGLNLSHLYLGVTLTDYLGGSDSGATDRALLFGGEVGYSGTFGRHLILRPLLGVGDTFLYHREPGSGGGALTPGATTPGAPDVVTSASGVTSSTGSSGGTAGSSGTSSGATTVKNIYVAPKLVALFGYDHFFASASFGALFVPGILYGPAPAESTTWIAYTFETQIGFRL